MSELSRRYRVQLLSITAFGTLLRDLMQSLLPLLVPTLMSDFSLSADQAGLTLTLLVGLGAVFQYVGGCLCDQLTRKTVFQFAFVAFFAGSVLLFLSPTYIVFLVGIVVVGVAAGVYPPAAVTQLSDTFPKQTGRVLGINTAAANAAGVVSTAVVLFVLPSPSWRLVFLPAVAFAICAAVLTHTSVRGGYAVSTVRLNARRTVTGLLSSPRVRLVLLGSSLFSIAWQGTMGFLPTFLQVELGIPERTATLSFGALFVVGALANPLAGGIGDRTQYQATAVAASVTTLVGLVLLFLVDARATSVLGVVFLGVGLASYWPVAGSYMLETLPADTLGGDYGAARTMYLAVGSTGPAIVGWVSVHTGFRWAVASLCAVTVCSGVVWLKLAYSV
jgi:MFS family permease